MAQYLVNPCFLIKINKYLLFGGGIFYDDIPCSTVYFKYTQSQLSANRSEITCTCL